MSKSASTLVSRIRAESNGWLRFERLRRPTHLSFLHGIDKAWPAKKATGKEPGMIRGAPLLHETVVEETVLKEGGLGEGGGEKEIALRAENGFLWRIYDLFQEAGPLWWSRGVRDITLEGIAEEKEGKVVFKVAWAGLGLGEKVGGARLDHPLGVEGKTRGVLSPEFFKLTTLELSIVGLQGQLMDPSDPDLSLRSKVRDILKGRFLPFLPGGAPFTSTFVREKHRLLLLGLRLPFAVFRPNWEKELEEKKPEENRGPVASYSHVMSYRKEAQYTN